MGGSSVKSFVRSSISGSPLSPLHLLGKTGSKLANLDPMEGFTSAAFDNTWDVLSGKRQFGDHDNWFGSGPTGELMNEMVMGQRSDVAAANRELWEQYYAGEQTQWPKAPTVDPPVRGTDDTTMYGKKKKKVAPVRGSSLLDEED